MSRSRARLAAAATAALLTTAGLVLVAPAAVAAGPTATFTKTSDWGTGWEGNYRISNPGPGSISSWTVEFDLPTGHRVSSLWDATWSQSGAHVTVRNASWNGTIGAGGSTSFGFGVAYSGATARRPTGRESTAARSRRARGRRDLRRLGEARAGGRPPPSPGAGWAGRRPRPDARTRAGTLRGRVGLRSATA